MASPVPETESPTRRAGLFALAFGAGFAVLTIEIAGARLIAPVFGLSAVPWTAVIGVILAALALGNHLGGRLADAGRVPLSRILILAGVTGIFPVVGESVPWFARSALGFVPGAVLSAVILFAPPVLCLGAVVPYLVQADTESLANVGRRAGDVSAAATAGSILGSFVTGFFLLPAMPLPLLLGSTAAALFVMALAASRLLGEPKPGRGPVVAVLAVPALGALASSTPADTIHAEQTLYTSVAVTEREWADGRLVRELWQNGGSSSAEYVRTGEPAHSYVVASLGILEPLIADMDRVLVLGGAALTLPVALQELHADWTPLAQDGGNVAVERSADPEGTPSATEAESRVRATAEEAPTNPLLVDVVEIDPAVTRLAERYFVYGRRERSGIHVIHEDGRVFLRDSDALYDLVYLDVFDHLLTVPWTMVTEEALTDMAARLTSGGIFMANVLSPLEGEGTAFLARFRATLETVFADVRMYRADPHLERRATQNLVVVATVDRGVLPGIRRPQAGVTAEGRPLADDWAPVEYLQAKVFLEGLRWR